MHNNKHMTVMQITGVSQLKLNAEHLYKFVYKFLNQAQTGFAESISLRHMSIPPDRYPLIPGHQVIGQISKIVEACRTSRLEQRVGLERIFRACGGFQFYSNGFENLCTTFQTTDRYADG